MVADSSITYANPSGNTWTAKYEPESGDTEGNITFSIDFDDLAGNDGVDVTAVTDGTSVTFDKTVPTLTSVSIASDNSTTTLAKVGDEITLSFTASESLHTPVVTFQSGGNNISTADVVAGSGTSWTAKYTANSSDTNGAVTFTIAFEDLATNDGTNVTAVTNGTSVTFDKTAPTLTSVSIASNNSPGPTTHAKVGLEVILSFTASEVIQTNPTVVFQSGGAAITNAGAITYATADGGTTWTAKYVTSQSDSSGTVTFSIDFDDLAGNDGSDVTSGSGSVTFTRTAPTLTCLLYTSDAADE